jgi:hypothetical protein
VTVRQGRRLERRRARSREAQPRARSVRRRALASGVLALSAGALAACSSSASPAPPSLAAVGVIGGIGTVPPIPLTSSSAGPTSTWTTIALGHLDDPVNTFWQLFTLPSGSTRWELSTPPGVASNGGLVASVAAGTVLAGFEPSQGLLFSPLAQSTDQGASWSPGLLPSGLAPVPDSLVTTGAGPAVALLRSDGGTVASTNGDLSTWKTVVTERALAGLPATASCSVRRLTAVVADSGPTTASVGAVCARGSRAGIFRRFGAGWTSVGPVLPDDSNGPTEVIRLVHTSAGTAALVSAGSGITTSLHALWSGDGMTTWTVSAGLPLTGSTLASTGITADGGFVIAISSGTSGTSGTSGRGGPARAATIDPSVTAWRALTRPPSGTTAVVATPTGSFDALIGHNSTLTVDTLGASGWTRTQTLGITIQYGSSG